MKIIRTFAVLFCALVLSAGVRAAGEAAQEEDLDVVVQWNNAAPPVPPTKVLQDDYLIVKGGYKGAAWTKEAYLVKDVIYADKDTNYQLGLEKRDEGRHTLAALHFTKALEMLKDRKWAAEYCNYNIGNAFFSAQIYSGYAGRQLKYSPAADYFKRALDANPKSRFMLDIVTKLPVCYAEMADDCLKEAVAKEALAKKEPKEAAAALKEAAELRARIPGLLKDADAAVKDADDRIKKYREEFAKVAKGTAVTGYTEAADRAVVQLAIGKALIAEKRAASKEAGVTYATAQSLWHDARNKAKKYPDLGGDAVEGELRTLIQMQDFEKAVQEAQFIIDKYNQQSDYSLLSQLPAAYMSLGKANYAQGLKSEGEGNALKGNNAFAEARWAFLNVIVQFSGNDESVAQAHYLAGLCYEKLKNVEKEDAQIKAIREWQSVVNNFPKSDSFQSAKAKLEENGIKVEEPVKKAPAPAAKTTAAPPAQPPAPKPAK